MPGDPFPIGGLTRQEEAERLATAALWQKVMVSPEGRAVLSHVLRDLGLFTPVSGERMAGRHEAAILLMEHMRSVNDALCLSIISELLTHDRPSEE